MAQPIRWLWGLAPLALLWAIGNVALDDAVQCGIGRRAVAVATAAAGNPPGARPIVVAVAGRDIALSGDVSTIDGAAKAMAQLQAEFGIRRAFGGLSQAVAQKPYTWFAVRDSAVVQLSGHVPNEAAAKANIAAAEAALPGAKIIDRQVLAFGAPADFSAIQTGVWVDA